MFTRLLDDRGAPVGDKAIRSEQRLRKCALYNCPTSLSTVEPGWLWLPLYRRSGRRAAILRTLSTIVPSTRATHNIQSRIAPANNDTAGEEHKHIIGEHRARSMRSGCSMSQRNTSTASGKVCLTAPRLTDRPGTSIDTA